VATKASHLSPADSNSSSSVAPPADRPQKSCGLDGTSWVTYRHVRRNSLVTFTRIG
jgi:hypothetical protein